MKEVDKVCSDYSHESVSEYWLTNTVQDKEILMVPRYYGVFVFLALGS